MSKTVSSLCRVSLQVCYVLKHPIELNAIQIQWNAKEVTFLISSYRYTISLREQLIALETSSRILYAAEQ